MTAAQSGSRLFLSYARADRARVEPLVRALEAAGHRIWWDSQITGGSAFSDAIERELAAADAILVAWSAAAVRSDWVRDEASVGRERGRLVPLTLDGALPPLGFRQYHTIDLSHWKGDASAAVLVDIGAAIAAAGGAAAPGSAPRSRRRVAKAAALMAVLGAVGIAGLGLWMSFGRAPVAVSAPGAAEEPPELSLTAIETIGPEIPAGFAAALKEELRVAIGQDSAVTLTEAGAAGIPGPAYRLTGSVRRSKDELRAALRLDDPEGRTVWSRAFVRPMADWDLAARQIGVLAAQILRCTIVRAGTHPQPLPHRTLTLVAQKCDYEWDWEADDSPQRMQELAQRMIEASPDFSLGWSELAYAQFMAMQQRGGPTRDEVERSVAEALRLDPRNTAAMIVEGLLLPPTDWIGRERIWRRAATARATDAGYEHAHLGLLLLQTGRIEEAIAALRRGVVADPVYPGLSLTLAYAYRLAGRDAEAERVYDRVQDLWPESGTLQFRFWRDAVTDGQFDTARTAARAFASAAGVPPALIEEATRSIEAGRPFDPELARQVREDPAPTQEEAVTVTTAQLLTGDIGAALATIAAVHDRVDVPVTHMLFDPAMQAHWGTPRFAAVVEQLGLGVYWRTNGPPDLCRAADRPAACRNWAPPAARPA